MPEHARSYQLFNRILDSDIMPGAYDGIGPGERALARGQASMIQADLKVHLPGVVALAHPEYQDAADTERTVAEEIQYVTLKAVAFCGLLAAGQIKNERYVRDVVRAICMMYLSDQAIDDGDIAMLVATEQLFGGRLPRNDDPPHVTAHSSLGKRIPVYLSGAVLLDDLPRVKSCFVDHVLSNEARHRRLSDELFSIRDDRAALRSFWESQGENLGDIMTTMAGFPSVSHSLHAAHRRDNPKLRLPPLRHIDTEPELSRLLRISNVLVRLLDDIGDSTTDWGEDQSRGKFSINWLNQAPQAGPHLIEPLLRLGEIPQAEHRELTEALMNFGQSSSEEHKNQSARHITQFALHHARTAIADLSPAIRRRYRQYIQYAQRVHIIGQINAMGDKALADTPPPLDI